MAADPDRRARFEREARAVAALNHPNIVTLHSVEEADTSTGSGQAGSVHFITMELVEGQTLTQLLPRNGFPLSRLLEIAIPLADAVSFAHRAGITHRDLKPDNIMIDGRVGCGCWTSAWPSCNEPSGPAQDPQVATVTSDTAEGRVLGTVAYMSPEQAEGKNVDSRSDVFSLGTILYELASGARPFRGDTPMSTIGAILKDEPVSITEMNRSLPRHAGRILRRCLAKDPDRRYQTALELRNELEELKAEIDTGVHAAGSQNSPAGRRWSTRRLVALGVGAVLAVAVLFSILQWVRRKSPDPVTSYIAVPITSAIGQEMGPNWSPEGEFIAFARVREGSYDVMVQPVAGGEALVRADGPGDETAPRWSPDGRYLAYVSTSEPELLVPTLGEQPDGRGADENAGLERNADLVRDPDGRVDIADHGACGAVGTDGKSGVDDLSAQRLDVRLGARPGSGKPDVGRVHSESVHQVEDPLLGLDGRIGDRRGLQSVAQRLVVEHDLRGWFLSRGGVARVPVVNQLVMHEEAPRPNPTTRNAIIRIRRPPCA